VVKGELWALAKPAGMAVHPAGEAAGLDLVTWALTQADAPPGMSPVNRLDRGTSGLVLMSADAELRGRLGQAFAQGKVRKDYRALVHGRARKKGVIRRPLPDSRRGRALEAVTRYRLLEALGRCSYLRVRPETGRKHQIRRHLAGVGLPVLGDRRHGERSDPPGAPERLWLHCARLVIPDASIDLRAPLPGQLKEHLESLRSRPGRLSGSR